MAPKPFTLSALGLVVGLVGAAALLAPACSRRPIEVGDGGDATFGTTGGGGNSGATGGAGTTGAAGTIGAAGSNGTGSGGSAGTTGGAGSGGSGGMVGGGGRGGTGVGGASGGRGGAGPGPECATAADCKLVSDCCTCAALPVGATEPSCPAICKQSQCAARQLASGAVACAAGRCVAGFACDASQVTCRIAPPTCPAGEVPAVNDAGNCYLGTCAPATGCTTVAGCGACTFTTEACVSYQTQFGAQHHCVTLLPECNGNGGCSCLGVAACLPPYRSCTDYSGIRGVSCSCPNC